MKRLLPLAPRTEPVRARPGVLVVGHGSRAPGANQDFEALVRVYAERHPELVVAHAYVELAEPALGPALVALGQRCSRVVVLPLFLFAAGHVKNDLPIALSEARRVLPGTEFIAAEALGVHAELVALARERLDATGTPEPDKTAVLVVGRGSSDPDANGDFCKLVRLIGEGQSYAAVLPAFMGITTPRVDAGLETLARARPESIVVLPYLLFAGRLIEKLEEQVAEFRTRTPWIGAKLAEPLGADARVLQALDDRVELALGGGRPLACDACQYRVPIADVTSKVGGLKALLWSLRHAFTHTQAMPHAHAHAPLTKHVLVCGNADCADRGSILLLGTLRRLVKRAGRSRDIRVTRTSCMGRCGEGPTVVVYPDGIWYRGMTVDDADELVHGHLLSDRLLGRRVDNIMQ